jgi:hypothetical protein
MQENPSFVKPELPHDIEYKAEQADQSDDLTTASRLFEEAKKSFLEAEPRERNFEIILKESESGIEIFLKHKETGEEIYINEFLPPKHSFVRDERFNYKPWNKKIGVPEMQLQFQGSLLALFHELGHSHQGKEHAMTTSESLKALLSALSKFIKSISIKKEVRGEGENKKTIYNMASSLTTDQILPDWYVEKLTRQKAISERDAWAYALKAVRKLKKKGIDILAEFENVNQIKSYIAFCLCTKDIDYALKKLGRGNITKEEIESLTKQPIFNKHR